MRRYHLYGIGAGLVDTELEVTDEFLNEAGITKGQMTLVDEQRQAEIIHLLNKHQVVSKRASGGSACNTIIAASYFGSNTFYSCKVADDDNGRFFQHDTLSAGVHTSNKDLPDGTTGKCLVLITPDAERTMNTYLGISASLSEEDLELEAIKDSEYLYVEGYLVTSDTGRQAAIKARKVAQENGVKTALSLSDPGMVEFFSEGLSEMIGEQLDLIFCNRDEALAWTSQDSLEQAAESLKKHAKTFAITLGKEGALVYDGQGMTRVDGFSANAIDTNGAGDMFAGAFLHAICSGQTYAEAAKLANLAASKVVSQYGPRLLPEQHSELTEDLSTRV